MPTLNFTKVLRSPRFQDKFVVTSVNATVGLGGLQTETSPPAVLVKGIIVPGKSNLRISSDGLRVVAYIEVYTTYPLSSGIKTTDAAYRDADVIGWHGRHYTVNQIEDYSAFGPGFLKAGCDLLEIYPSL